MCHETPPTAHYCSGPDRAMGQVCVSRQRHKWPVHDLRIWHAGSSWPDLGQLKVKVTVHGYRKSWATAGMAENKQHSSKRRPELQSVQFFDQQKMFLTWSARPRVMVFEFLRLRQSQTAICLPTLFHGSMLLILSQLSHTTGSATKKAGRQYRTHYWHTSWEI